MKNFVYIATSLDGYIADKNGDVDWLNKFSSTTDDYGYSEFIKSIDAIVMGRNTYQKVLTFDEWPYDRKVFLLSNTISSIPKELNSKVELKNGNVTEIIRDINKEGYKNLYIDGGKTVQSFLKLNLIDELIITRIPVLLGSGIRLFGELDNIVNLKLVSSKVLANGLVQDHYMRIND